MKASLFAILVLGILSGCVTSTQPNDVVGQYINVGYRPVNGYWLHIMADGRYESAPISSALGGSDRGVWTRRGDQLLLISEISGESAASVRKENGRVIVRWKNIDYANTGERPELFQAMRKPSK